jgi:hypothetical protein
MFIAHWVTILDIQFMSRSLPDGKKEGEVFTGGNLEL